MTHIRYYILLLLTLLSTLAWAEGEEDESASTPATTPNVIIGGNVYGGGRRGAILEKKTIDVKNELGEVTGTREVTGLGQTNVRIYAANNEDVVIGNEETVERGMGNVFGAGFGARANVRFTSVKMYGGTVKNSLYGGGEIAAVGKGVTREPIDKVPVFEKVIQQGGTTVELYKGHVERDVFGGGRGYTEASDDGTMALDRLYTDGYVFGSTKVRIYGGEVGTSEGVAKGYGNVFGGGNVGFVYSGNQPQTVGTDVFKNAEFLEDGKKYYVIPSEDYLTDPNGGKLTSDEYALFFADPDDADPEKTGDLSIACDVRIEPRCQVTSASAEINGHTYTEGMFVPFVDLDLYSYDKHESATTTAWSSHLNEDGVVIHNAIFAGGNVSTGDSQIYAETTTVYGNVVATVNDLYSRDLITIGTEHTGGLYGDGNLTFVDGYRELNITNYGTDYYSLDDRIEMDEYESLNTREKAYFQIEYECKTSYTSTVKKDGNGDFHVFAVGERILQEDYEKEIASNSDLAGKWTQAGFCSIYAGRLLNTIQRADFAGMFGSRLVLQGAADRVVNKGQGEDEIVDFAQVYTLNRIGELSLNKQRKPGLTGSDDPDLYTNYHGNYFGIYSNVNFLGALTSDVRFDEDPLWVEDTDKNRVTFDENPDDDKPDTYLEWKRAHFTVSKEKNKGMSDNMMALASGVSLELRQEKDNLWGPITGIVQLELINVEPGEGGGFVYARNEHGLATRRHVDENDDSSPLYYRTFLSEDNYQGATHEEYTYTDISANETEWAINHSGNFVTVFADPASKQYIVDDCYPQHNQPSTGIAAKAHYWYVRGEIYTYNQTISAYTGAAKKYEAELKMPLTIASGENNGRIRLMGIYPGYFCNLPEGESVVVGEVEYKHNDPISWWDYQKILTDEDKAKFTLDSEYKDVNESGDEVSLNNMSHQTGYVLTLEFDQPGLSFYSPTTSFTYHSKDNPSDTWTEYGPSYSPKKTGPYGQRYYGVGSLIPSREVTDYETNFDGITLSEQAKVTPYGDYYLCTQSLQLNDGGEFLLTKGDLVPKNDGGVAASAIVDRYIAIIRGKYVDELTDADRNAPCSSSEYTYTNLQDEAEQRVSHCLTECHRVTNAGYYGGSYYTSGEKYDAIDGWCSLTDADRNANNENGWKFNDDALDLLWTNQKYYDGDEPDENDPDYGWVNLSTALTSSPVEKTTLYVSKDSHLSDLQGNKKITVYFQYQYDEPGQTPGTTVTSTERHYINITIEFKDELPDVREIKEPDLVMPGTVWMFKTPEVVAGAYGVIGGDWEIYDNEADARTHINGRKYENRSEPFYWYQDGYWVNYYALTTAGKQYSPNPVRIKVANYHDLKEVMADSDYRGIGMRKNYPAGTPEEEKQRSPKIYINDYSKDDGEDAKNGIDLLKKLFNETYTDAGLSSTVPGCRDLEIILRSDLAPKVAGSWTSSIGSGDADKCFGGNLHGDGYTISGLNASLFNKICSGNVYNLGVTGEFPSGSSGITDHNNGRIENCWVYDTSASADNTTKPIANNGNDGVIVNSYYNDDKFTTTSPPTEAIGKDPEAFYNGNVTYELNGFYLKEHNRKVANGDLTGSAYETEGNLTGLTPNYVEDRYGDGDFVYAGGELLPQDEDVRYGKKTVHDDEENEDIEIDYWYAQYPEDYIFFGQSLSYGHGDVTHQDLPGRIGVVDSESNRVYRAPAYFQNATASKAYYNDHAVFAAQSADGSHDVYPHMTAIDFTGYTSDGTPSTILDHAPLKSFLNADLTQNLLVYAGASDKSVIRTYLDSKEPIYEETTAAGSTGDYRRVAVVPAVSIKTTERTIKGYNDIKGHAVYLNDGGEYQAESDHFLVDRQEFFAPIEYSFISVPTPSDPESQRATRMWYQRQPDNYVVINEGWEVVSLPFTAELVTTQDKGEITHFYNEEGRATLADSKKSHEYWLREYGQAVTPTAAADILVAVFNYPDHVPSDPQSKNEFTNTFLWDYYYSKEGSGSSERVPQLDENQDTYWEFYQSSRSYEGYPFLKAGTPYLIGFPGKKYYEFDLSGVFEAKPKHSLDSIPKLDPQVITFASEANGTIPVSSEKAVVGEGTGDGYNFVPCLVETEHEANNDYVLNAAGSSFDKITSSGELTVLTVPFRPFFTSTSRYNSRTRSLLFGYGDKEETHEAEPREADEPGQLIIRSGQHRIIVSSSLSESTTVRIVNVSGITLHTFDIAPGETIEKFIPNQGVYIVQTVNGHYTKKLAVK